ncbi:MAG TPA: DUF2796 domain-containing protein [Ramlibacter sp.]
MHVESCRRRGPAPFLGAAVLVGLSLCSLHGAAVAHTPGAHVHGNAELNVVSQGAQLEIELQAPLDSVLGFEHAPRTGPQRDAVRAMAARMRQSQSLFAPTPEAGCSPTSVRLTSSVLAADLLGEPVAASPAAGKPAGDHSDLAATFSFRCNAPERLRGLEAGLQKAFPGIKNLKVQVVSARGQKAVGLSRGRTSVQW